MTTPDPLDAGAWLVDDRWSKAYALTGETHIGRGVGSSIILRDPVISRRHASVVMHMDGYMLQALGSAGTKVNGANVETQCVLREGDIIEIANTKLRFTMMAPTGEMFVVARDTPTTIDRTEGPTRATVKATVIQEPIWRRHSFAIFVAAVLFLLFLTIFFARSGVTQ
jgi:pSer/pThr/pTyr-binding forkhead associated (FHA) protein